MVRTDQDTKVAYYFRWPQQFVYYDAAHPSWAYATQCDDMLGMLEMEEYYTRKGNTAEAAFLTALHKDILCDIQRYGFEAPNHIEQKKLAWKDLQELVLIKDREMYSEATIACLPSRSAPSTSAAGRSTGRPKNDTRGAVGPTPRQMDYLFYLVCPLTVVLAPSPASHSDGSIKWHHNLQLLHETLSHPRSPPGDKI